MRLDPATIDLRATAAGVQLRPVAAAVQLALSPQWVALACGSVLLDQPGFLLRREYAAADDTMAAEAGKNLADEVESSDSFALAVHPVWEEVATAVDSFSASFVAYLTLSDTPTAVDAQFSGFTKVLGEMIVATDQMSYVVDVAAVINQVELNGGVL